MKLHDFSSALRPDARPEIRLRRYRLKTTGHTAAAKVRRPSDSLVAHLAKRAIDLVGSAMGIALTSPVLVVIAVAIKFDSPGPVFFRQIRNGCGGAPFRIFKFRTMSVMEDGDRVTQVRRGDERVTRLGRFLRRTSLDELPQLFNVLSGEMSLVGPRPHARAHDEHYGKLISNYRLRQTVMPGMTGWAQVNGYRGETPSVDVMYRRIEHDLWYAANCSVALDLLILLQTLKSLWRAANVY